MKPRRSKVKYPMLDPKYNSKIKQESLDMDYINKLSEDEKKWLNDFLEEEVNGNVGKHYDADRVNRFNNAPEDRKACTDRVNQKNRCIFGQAKAAGTLDYGLDYIPQSAEDVSEDSEDPSREA